MAEAPDQLGSVDQRQRTELWAIVVLSVSALVSSYAGFQEGRWDSEQAAHFALASTMQTAASKEETIAFQRESVNAMHFTQWLNAYANDNFELADFYRNRFRPSFHDAFDRWMASRPRFNKDSPPTPFDVPGYREQSRASSERLKRQAERYFAAGKHDIHISDSYGRAVMILALALFLGGMVQAFHTYHRRMALLVLATLTALFGLASLIQLPVLAA